MSVQAMISGLILTVAILVLGGVIAASGDRIGTRVGKARLSLFNLRPRQTATLVTIATGSLIAASTLAVIFGASKQLRTGVFHLNQIQAQLKDINLELSQAIEQKNQVEKELAKARSEQADAQKLLDNINKSLQAAIAKQKNTEAQLNNTQRQLQTVSQQRLALSREIKPLQAERQELISQRNQVKAQVTQLNSQVTQLDAQVTQLKADIPDLKAQIKQRDTEIAKRDFTIAQRNSAIAQRKEVEKNLKTNIKGRETRLSQIEQQLQSRATQLISRQTELAQQEQQLQERQARLQEQEKQLQQVEAQLTSKEAQLSEKDKQIQELDRRFQQLSTQLESRDKQLQELSAQLESREKRLAFLEREVGTLEQYYQVLRQGNVTILRNQVLASGVLRIIAPDAASGAIDQLLSQANRTAIEATRPGTEGKQKERVVQISQVQISQLLNQIKDGRDYVVRILSAGNYVVGEKQVQVFADVALNQVVFSAGDIVATSSAEPSTMSEEEIRKRVELLLAASQFRAGRAGILGNTIQIGDGRITTLISFLEQIEKHHESVELQAVAASDTYTAGPLKIKLQAIQDGRVVFST